MKCQQQKPLDAILHISHSEPFCIKQNLTHNCKFKTILKYYSLLDVNTCSTTCISRCIETDIMAGYNQQITNNNWERILRNTGDLFRISEQMNAVKLIRQLPLVCHLLFSQLMLFFSYIDKKMRSSHYLFLLSSLLSLLKGQRIELDIHGFIV